MKIKDVEEFTKMSRTNIRFYEMEGFINPTRHKNGYREYSEEDVNTLKKVKFLRNLNISLEDIKFIHHHSIDFKDYLHNHLEKLNLEKENMNSSILLCEKMIQDEISYENLDVDSYSHQSININQTETKQINSKELPWRRFFARILDISFYYLIYMCYMAFYTSHYLDSIDRSLRPLSDILFMITFMFVLEPILLSNFQTTLGKFILGIKVMSTKDKKLSYLEALKRTCYVFINGMGCFFPFINLYCLYRSFVTCESGNNCVWEESNKTVFIDNKKIHSLLYAFVLIICAYSCIVCNNIASFPLLRAGDIHDGVGEIDFGGNFNNYLIYDEKYNILEDGAMLYIDGIMINDFKEPLNDRRFPQIYFVEDENHNIVELNISANWNDRLPSSYREIMSLSVLSLIKANESVFNPFSKADRIVEYIEEHPFESFEFIEDVYTISCNVEYGGGYEKNCYKDSCTLSVVTYADNYIEPDPYYHFSFSIKLHK